MRWISAAMTAWSSDSVRGVAAEASEALRMTAHLGMKEPTARDFAHALVQQPAFRKAIAHEMLHDIYIETHGRAL